MAPDDVHSARARWIVNMLAGEHLTCSSMNTQPVHGRAATFSSVNPRLYYYYSLFYSLPYSFSKKNEKAARS
jgi:hypothetical protein